MDSKTRNDVTLGTDILWDPRHRLEKSSSRDGELPVVFVALIGCLHRQVNASYPTSTSPKTTGPIVAQGRIGTSRGRAKQQRWSAFLLLTRLLLITCPGYLLCAGILPSRVQHRLAWSKSTSIHANCRAQQWRDGRVGQLPRV